MQKERRGRPSETPQLVKEKYIQTIFEVPTKPEIGCKSVWRFDKKISQFGPISVDITYPKGFKSPKMIAEKGKSYAKHPVVVVFKTSNRSNAKTKIKVFANENIDYILNADKLVGIPEKAEYLEIGVGKSFIKKYKEQYNLK